VKRVGKKGVSAHLKRLTTPSYWPIHRKEKTWVTRPSPGPHPLKMSMPLSMVIRDVLKFAATEREAEAVMVGRKVKVDGKVRVDKKFPIGLMDIIEFADADKAYMVIPSTHRVYSFHPITGEEKKFKLCRIESKTLLKGGKVQLNLHDGRNILIQITDPTKPEEDIYSTFDVIQLDIANRKIMKQLKLKEGAYGIVVEGKNTGKHGTITGVGKYSTTAPRIVKIKGADDVEYSTIADYVFVIGEDKPLIPLPED
jgi:small subunit ribosomal protein S4e